jgi:hypothetical protein
VNRWNTRASKPTGKCSRFGFPKEPISYLFEFQAGNRTNKLISDDHHDRNFVPPAGAQAHGEAGLRDVRAPLIAIRLMTLAVVPDSSTSTSQVSS